MALFGNIQQSGRDIAKGYENAQAYMQPYYEGGVDAYNQYSDYLEDMGNQLDSYGNPADWMWTQINQNPAAFYQDLMAGYTETPEAQYAMDQMMRAINQGASASGMTGSGAYFKNLQDNAYNIIARDQDRYFNNILGANNQQRGYLNDYRGVQTGYMGGLSGLSQMGQNAASQQGQNAVGEGYGNAQASAANNPYIDPALGIGGTVAGYLKKR